MPDRLNFVHKVQPGDGRDIGMWKGEPIESLERDELLTIIKYLSRKLQESDAMAASYREHVDWGTYLSDGTGEPDGRS